MIYFADLSQSMIGMLDTLGVVIKIFERKDLQLPVDFNLDDVCFGEKSFSIFDYKKKQFKNFDFSGNPIYASLFDYNPDNFMRSASFDGYFYYFEKRNSLSFPNDLKSILVFDRKMNYVSSLIDVPKFIGKSNVLSRKKL